MSSYRVIGLGLLLAAALATAETIVHWKPVASGQNSRATAPSQTLFRTQAAFEAYWTQNFGSLEEPRGIDWAKSELIAINLGHRGSPNYMAGVSTITESGGETMVKWFERVPGAKANQQARRSSPYVIVSIPASSNPVVFQGHVEEPGRPFSDGNVFPIRKLVSGGHSFVKDGSFEVIDTSSELTELWRTAFGRATEPPKANFNDWRYVAIFLGQRPTPGYELVIQRIARIGPKEVQVLYTETKPAKGAIEPQMVTNPFVVLEFPRTDDEVTVQRGG